MGIKAQTNTLNVLLMLSNEYILINFNKWHLSMFIGGREIELNIYSTWRKTSYHLMVHKQEHPLPNTST